MALRSPHGDEPVLCGDLFLWPHLMSSGNVLFVVDDVGERAVKEVASRSYERV